MPLLNFTHSLKIIIMKKLHLILLCLPMIGFGQLDNPRIGMKVGNSFSTITANNFNGLPLEEWTGVSEKIRQYLRILD